MKLLSAVIAEEAKRLQNHKIELEANTVALRTLASMLPKTSSTEIVKINKQLDKLEKVIVSISKTSLNLSELKAEKIASLEQFGESIIKDISHQNSPYYYAVNVYSTTELNMLDDLSRMYAKYILRNYFAENGGHTYEGWI